MDYRKTAQEIYDHIGKKENIISAAHCATRLRLVISDNSKADKEYVENIEGVKGVFFAQGQMQIILGTGVVNKVYDEFIRIAGVSESSKEELKKVAASRANPVQTTGHRVISVNIDGVSYITDVGVNYEHHRIPLRLKNGLVQNE